MSPTRRLVMVGLLALLAVPFGPVAAKSPAKKDGPKVPPNYVMLPKLRLAVQVDANRQYRMLELEAWLAYKTPEDAAKVNTFKASVAEAMKEDFLGYNWEAFTDPVDGVEMAKTIVKSSVERTIKDAPPLDDVLIRGMILR